MPCVRSGGTSEARQAGEEWRKIMKWFIDTEFSERGPKHPIELISIALVSEKDHAIYLVSNEFDEAGCNDWVRENVLSKLDGKRFSLENIRKNIFTFIDYHEHAEHGRCAPSFWGYFSDYDWVVFCQIFGRMIDLPKGWPKFCLDVRQVMEEYEIRRDQLPPIDKNAAHDALYDARWTREAYIRCREIADDKIKEDLDEAFSQGASSERVEF